MTQDQQRNRLQQVSQASSPRYKTPLVVCPFGGAGYSSFRSWSAMPHPIFPTRIYTYPGRGQRIFESFAGSVESLALEVAVTLRSEMGGGGNWVLAGHSLGALVAFEVCTLLEKWRVPPKGVVLSGCHPPHLPVPHPLNQLEDDQFVDKLITNGGAPEELRSIAEFRQMFLPALRADYRIAEAYARKRPAPHDRLPTPCLLLWGKQDPEVSPEEALQWSEWFGGEVTHHAFEGDHFYPVRQPEAFFAAIAKQFQAVLN